MVPLEDGDAYLSLKEWTRAISIGDGYYYGKCDHIPAYMHPDRYMHPNGSLPLFRRSRVARYFAELKRKKEDAYRAMRIRKNAASARCMARKAERERAVNEKQI